ncbi:proteasome 26S subunit [Pyrrhoderma noxium]|uniref:Proteasome 26S subunit n=1 Tax=Pyrrhoderma noxium TaxID=2282107 RepID=A0A286U8B5_9AGAM|nr:proteasome 26S subunit [Pyrrhoderma noxium]
MSSSSTMAIDKPEKLDVETYLTTALSATPQELHPFFEAFQSLHQRKLWHQLTQKLFEFFRHELSKPYRVDVFSRFVRDFEERLNPLKLVEMGVFVSKEIDNPATHLAFLTSLLSRIDIEKSPEAHILLLSSLAHAKLLYGDLEGTRSDIDNAWKVLDDLDGVDPSVNAGYYSVAADYYKAKADFGQYYKNSLLYLACIDPMVDLAPDDRILRAHNLSVAALIGDTIYNFGELLMHPILSSLDGTTHEWIKKLLFTFNAGDIGKFEALAPVFPKEPILQENYPFLRQKICLMALIDSVFRRNADSRTITFQTISEETRLPLNDVEHLMMKAFSLGLLRGSLDEIDQTARITWVQPRVLDRTQIGALADRLKAWTDKLKSVEQRITPELLTTA